MNYFLPKRTQLSCGTRLHNGHAAHAYTMIMRHMPTQWSCGTCLHNGHAAHACTMVTRHTSTQWSWGTRLHIGHVAHSYTINGHAAHNYRAAMWHTPIQWSCGTWLQSGNVSHAYTMECLNITCLNSFEQLVCTQSWQWNSILWRSVQYNKNLLLHDFVEIYYTNL